MGNDTAHYLDGVGRTRPWRRPLIGSKDSFVDACLDVFRGKKSGKETGGTRFDNWFARVLEKVADGEFCRHV